MLSSALRREFNRWTRSLAFALKAYESWLTDALGRELIVISNRERQQLIAPLQKLKNQVFRTLQNFRDRLSDQSEKVFGVPLRTTEAEIQLSEPQRPDVRIGYIFDHNWELLSPIATMWLLKRIVAHHFSNKLSYMVEKNLSRLTSNGTKRKKLQ